MRGGHDTVCGCFPTGRHYPGIAERIAAVVTVVRGLAEELDGSVEWARCSFAVIDFETTGLDHDHDRVLEIGIVCFDGGELSGRHEFLIDPGIPVPEEARKVHGITDEELANAPRFEELYFEIAGILANRVPVAYNSAFDKKFLLAEWRRCAHLALSMPLPPAFRETVEWIDPLVWVRELQKYEKGKKLTDVCERLGITLDRAHRASADAEATGRVLLALARDMPRTYAELIRIQGQYAAHQDVDTLTWRSRRN